MPGHGESRSRIFLRRDFRERLKIVEVESAFVSDIRVEQVGLNGSAYRKNFNQLSQ
jgi:hypothetical protein